MKYREIIADNLSKAGWSWGCVSALDQQRANNLLRELFKAEARGGSKNEPEQPQSEFTLNLFLAAKL